jgi:serine/threonine protein kinase
MHTALRTGAAAREVVLRWEACHDLRRYESPSGNIFGPYEICAPIGAGGMGEVYRARDTRLGRDVAIKNLPQHLTEMPDAKLRFERSAIRTAPISCASECA